MVFRESTNFCVWFDCEILAVGWMGCFRNSLSLSKSLIPNAKGRLVKKLFFGQVRRGRQLAWMRRMGRKTARASAFTSQAMLWTRIRRPLTPCLSQQLTGRSRSLTTKRSLGHFSCHGVGIDCTTPRVRSKRGKSKLTELGGHLSIFRTHPLYYGKNFSIQIQVAVSKSKRIWATRNRHHVRERQEGRRLGRNGD